MFAARGTRLAASTSSSTAAARTTSSNTAAAAARTRRHNHQLSYAQGASEPPLVTKTLNEYFTSEILAKHGSKQALVCRQETSGSHGGPRSRNIDDKRRLAWDFEEFDRHISSLARGLVSMGVKPGDRVGVVMGNNSSYAMLQWACARVGAILATMNPAYRTPELVKAIELAGIQHLVVVPRIRSSAYLQMLQDALPGLKSAEPGNIQDPAVPDLKNIIVVDNEGEFKNELEKLDLKCTIDWREVLLWREDTHEAKTVKDIASSLHKDDVINLQFTSGTTGNPKAVSLTHYNLLNNAISIGSAMKLTPNDILCNVPPLFHCFGLVLGNLAAWSHGASIVYSSPSFDPPSIVDAVTQEKCTALHGVPTHFLGVLGEVSKRRQAGERIDLNLRTGIAAGSPIPIDLMKKLMSEMNLVDLTNAYGMTETSPVSFQTLPSDPFLMRVESVGRVRPHVKAKVIDHDGNVVSRGKPGELCVAGYLVQKGYWKDEQNTKDAMKEEDGDVWMHTGDEAIMDEQGYLRIVGRIKDIIIRGGENLFPVQIENTLTACPAIYEAAAVSVPDSRFGEVVGAWIVRSPDAEGKKLSREDVRNVVVQSMNPQNAPAWVWFIGEDSPEDMPKTASGKVMKHVLRDWSKDLAKSDVGKVARA